MTIFDRDLSAGGAQKPKFQYQTTRANVMTILVAGMGSFVLGYDINSMAGTIVQASFVSRFLSGSNANSIIGGIIGGFLAGGLLGAVVQAPISNRFGRRIATGSGAILAIVSGALQAGSVHIAMFIVARMFCGISAGILISNCPVYMSEISPPHIRGMLVSNHAISIVSAYIFSSLMALAFHYVDAPYQWRLQFVLLAFFGLVLVVSLALLPESPRWLCEKGRYDEALTVLQRLHQSSTDPDAHLSAMEMAQIRAQIETEQSLPRGYMHIFRTPHLRHRAACSVLMWIMAQSTGILVIANLTPTLFGQLGLGVVLQLGLSSATWLCSILGCVVNAALLDQVGRVKLLVTGGYLCSGILICEAVLEKFYIGSADKAGLNAAVAFYFLFIFTYGSTVDCASYVYISEIWPTYLRSEGSTIAFVAWFCGGIAYSSPASLAFQQIGWKYYWVMVCVCIASATAMLFICPETARLALEEINAKFGDPVVLQLGEEVGPIADRDLQEEAKAEVEHVGEV